MTDSPYDAARPSEGAGKSKTTVSFWAELWRPMEKNSHGESLISPNFGTEPECVTWVREHRTKFDQVGMWRREIRGGDYNDIPLHTEEAPLPQPERVHDLVEDLKTMLLAKKVELDHPAVIHKLKTVGEFNPIERPMTYEELYES